MWYGQGSHLTEWDMAPYDEQHNVYHLQSQTVQKTSTSFTGEGKKNKRGEHSVSIQGMETDYCTCWVHKITSPDDTQP